jgi:hypothetical protein
VKNKRECFLNSNVEQFLRFVKEALLQCGIKALLVYKLPNFVVYPARAFVLSRFLVARTRRHVQHCLGSLPRALEKHPLFRKQHISQTKPTLWKTTPSQIAPILQNKQKVKQNKPTFSLVCLSIFRRALLPWVSALLPAAQS